MKRVVLLFSIVLIATAGWCGNTLRVGDGMRIYVSALDQEVAAMYNLPSIGEYGDAFYYIIDNEGDIHFPILGRVHAAGLSVDALRANLEDILSREIKRPLVTILLLDEHISVLGEVNFPQRIAIPGGQISVLEALAAAGGLTKKGAKGTIHILHEENGIAQEQLLTMDAVFRSGEVHYLTNHDVLYVK